MKCDDVIAVVHPEDPEMVTRALQHALDTRESFTVDHRIVGPEGTPRFITMHGVVMRDDHGP
jgi:hypothetical protein